jgi:hypothetical protein
MKVHSIQLWAALTMAFLDAFLPRQDLLRLPRWGAYAQRSVPERLVRDQKQHNWRRHHLVPQPVFYQRFG